MHDEVVESYNLKLVREDISRVIAWAYESDEEIPTEIAIQNARRVIEKVFWAWPQRFDVYPFDGTVGIDSEMVDQDFVMVLCKSDGSISAMADIAGDSLRKDCDGPESTEYDELVLKISGWLRILRQKRGTVETLEYNNSSRTGRSGEGGVVVKLLERREELQKEQRFTQSIQSIMSFTNISRQNMPRPESRISCPNCDETRRGSWRDILWMGGGSGNCGYQQWAQDNPRPSVRQSIPRRYPNTALSGSRGIPTASETDDSWRMLEGEPSGGITTTKLTAFQNLAPELSPEPGQLVSGIVFLPCPTVQKNRSGG